MNKLWVLWFVLLLAIPAQATNHYMSGSGTDGGAGTQGDPFSPVKACTTTLIVPGDFVYCEPETFSTGAFDGDWTNEYILAPTQNGTAGNPITWRNVPGSARPIFRGQDSPERSGIDILASRHLIFDSLDIRNVRRRAFRVESAANIIIRNCVIDSVAVNFPSDDNNPGGISGALGFNDSLEIYGNTFRFCFAGGVFMEYGVDSIAIYDNVFENCRTGVFFKHSTFGLRGVNAHVYDNIFFSVLGASSFESVNAIVFPGSYTMRNVFVQRNLFYGYAGGSGTDAAFIRWGITDGACTDTAIHHYMYITNNTFDCENQLTAAFRIEQTDENSSNVPLWDTSGIFNNIIVNAIPYDANHDGVLANYGYDCAVAGIGSVGSEWDFDFNMILDTSGSDIFRWTENSVTNQYDHAGWVAATGYSANDKLDDPEFVDQANRNYNIGLSSPAASGGHGGWVVIAGGDSLLMPEHFGAKAPPSAYVRPVHKARK